MDDNDETERAATIGLIAETMRSTVTVARALVDAGVRIDLAGLDRQRDGVEGGEGAEADGHVLDVEGVAGHA